MPKFTVDISEAALTRLQAVVAQYNANQGTALTVAEWLMLHIKEIALGAELAARMTDLERQSKDAYQAAVLAERQRLLDSLA